MNELRSIEYSNDLQFSRPWKGNGLGCGQPWIACKKVKTKHWKSGSGLRESLGNEWLTGVLETLDSYPEASWGDPEIFQMFVGPTTNRNIQKSRHAVTWLVQGFWLAYGIAICRTCGIKVILVPTILRHNFQPQKIIFPVKICQKSKKTRKSEFSVKMLCYCLKTKTNTMIWRKNINA